MSLEDYLNELVEARDSLQAQDLTSLSNLGADDQELLRRFWPQIPVERRVEIVRRLVALAEENVELTFELLFRFSLNDPEGEVREQAVLGLWECEERAIIEPLCTLLRGDEDERARVAAAQVLGQFALRAEFGELLPQDTRHVVATLLEVVEDLEEELEVRRHSLEALGPISSPEVRQLILDSYESADDRMRGGALRAMGRSGDPDWVPFIQEEMENPSPALRFEAVSAVAQIATPQAISSLIPLVDDIDPEVQWMAITALGLLGTPRAVAALHRCLSDPDSHIRETAADALEQLEERRGSLRLLRRGPLDDDDDDDDEDEEDEEFDDADEDDDDDF